MGKEEVEKMDLVNKLAKIRTIAEVASKSKSGFNYKYSDINEILAKVTSGMKKYNVSLVPNVTPGTTSVSKLEIVNTKVSKKGDVYDQKSTEMLVTADMTFTWVNNDNKDDRIEVPWVIVGAQSDPSQAFGSGLTYCTRYFLTNYFQMAQTLESDVDAYRSSQREAAKEADAETAREIVSEIDTKIKDFIAENQGKAQEIKEFASKYAKNGNYFSIKSPELAAKMLTDFKQKYEHEEEN